MTGVNAPAAGSPGFADITAGTSTGKAFVVGAGSAWFHLEAER